MNPLPSIHVHRVTSHVVQICIPTPTLPPSFETNTYIVHEGSAALWIDAGTEDTTLLDQALAVLESLHVTRVIGVIATHYHRDHTHGIPYIHRKTDAPVYVHPADMDAAATEMRNTPFGLPPLRPVLPVYQLSQVRVEIAHAPGHTQGHIHLAIYPDSVIIVGDHLAGAGSVWIGPPDGHMGDYYKALDTIAASALQLAGPGHGPVLKDAVTAAKALKLRREDREQQILGLIQATAMTADEIVEHVYADTVAPSARWAAVRTVEAHLQHLVELGSAQPVSSPNTQQFRASDAQQLPE